jgi:predicted glycoside hydrolase/deacetylase ChbG (UPF0249 family)
VRRLNVNADDFGLSEAVDRGILEAHARGIVTSTSMLATGEPCATTLARLRETATLGVGVHLNISDGRPVSRVEDVPSLVDPEGRFWSGQALLDALGRLEKGELRAELTAQVQRCRQLLGRELDHLDCHQHILLFHPNTLAVFLQLAKDLALPVRSPACFLEASRLDAFVRRIETENGIRLDLGNRQELAQSLAETYRRFGPVPGPDHFEYRFYGKQATWENLIKTLESLPSGTTELMCHPGGAEPGDPYGVFRPRELAILTTPGLTEKLRDLGIQQVRYGS